MSIISPAEIINKTNIKYSSEYFGSDFSFSKYQHFLHSKRMNSIVLAALMRPSGRNSFAIRNIYMLRQVDQYKRLPVSPR